MKKITVTYHVNDDQLKMLEEIVAIRKKTNPDLYSDYTVNAAFRSIMFMGSLHDINRKIEFWQELLEASIEKKEHEKTASISKKKRLTDK